jgi:hypothetical protein
VRKVSPSGWVENGAVIVYEMLIDDVVGPESMVVGLK